MPDTVDITPVGAQTPEGRERIAKAEQEWMHAKSEFANFMLNLIKDAGFDAFRRILRDGGIFDDSNEIEELIHTHDQTQEAFLRAVAGR